jgi:hypothetical protein
MIQPVKQAGTYRLLVGAVGVASLCMVWFFSQWSAPAVVLPLLAALVTTVMCVDGLRRPKRYQAVVLVVAIGVQVVFQVLLAALVVWVGPPLSRGGTPPTQHGIREYRLWLGTVFSSLAIYLACVYPLARSRGRFAKLEAEGRADKQR